MTELKLYKFLESEAVQQYNWTDDGTQFLIWVDLYNIKDFVELLGYDYLSEKGVDVNLQYNCICIDLVDFAECNDIDLENILKKEGM